MEKYGDLALLKVNIPNNITEGDITMSKKDYNKQVVKRERISREPLIIGVNIGNA